MALRYSIRQLEYFVAAGHAGSIAVAAERIRVSPPAISAAIAQLEAEFNLQLFTREHARGMSLTTGGRALYDKARMVLEDAAALRGLAGEVSGAVSGPIRIGCLNSLAPLLAASLRQSFATRYPGIEASQVVDHQTALFAGLRRGEIDVAITYDMEIPADLEFIGLADMAPYAMVAADHGMATRTAVPLAELAELPMILLDLPISRDYFLGLFRDAGLKPRIVERSTDLFMVRSLVANGFGYSIANLRPLSDTAPDGKPIVCVPLASPIRLLPLGVLMARADRRTKAVEAFGAHCREAIGQPAIPGMRGEI